MKKLIFGGLLVGLNALPSAWSNATNSNVPFPEPSQAWINEGTFVNRDNLRQMAVGCRRNKLWL